MKKVSVYLTNEEVNVLLKACVNDKERHLITILYGTGTRITEAINLKVRDINIKEEEILIRKGKGSKERVIPILPKNLILFTTPTNNFFDYIKNYIRDKNPEEFILKNNANNLRKKGLEQGQSGRRGPHYTIKRIQSRTNILKKISPHTFRASIATELIERGLSIRYVQKYLGHTDISTTTIYERGNISSTKRAMKSLSLNNNSQNLNKLFINPIDILDKRLASGELGLEQYMEIKKVIGK